MTLLGLIGLTHTYKHPCLDAGTGFRREIGKYVSKDEVARLERYVTVN